MRFQQVQVSTGQESQVSWKPTDTPGPSSRLEAADSLGKEVSGGIGPLVPTPSWGMRTPCRATRPLLDFHRGREREPQSARDSGPRRHCRGAQDVADATTWLEDAFPPRPSQCLGRPRRGSSQLDVTQGIQLAGAGAAAPSSPPPPSCGTLFPFGSLAPGTDLALYKQLI
ncbi:hypothetical protein HJG60_009510 [Phyllostomus discolor]|uniref:Uncharacterized protein n=1 Tax=Phyllostomus discolor TaxID=89673 RepID=A0A833YJV4_9CHIR|nr:hypothetical protein HJG60_009510 [Phyllostomus discolor]